MKSRWRTVLAASCGFVLAFAACAVTLAARCPYCGQEYGDAAPGDEARIAALRAAHEANCPMRPAGGGGGDFNAGGGNAVDWEARREAWRARAEDHCLAAETACENGDYDLAIAEASKACWMRWGYQKYSDVLNRAVALKRAQSEHEAGLVHEKLAQWDAAVVLYEAAVRDHPGNETYAASLARARAGKALAEQDRFSARLGALADELARPYPTPGLAFKGGSGRLPAIDRIEVPTPKITPKDYVQIKASKDWPKVEQQVVALSNSALRAIQDSAWDLKARAWEGAKEQMLSAVGNEIPGYETVMSIKDEAKELFKGMKSYTVGVYQFGMGGMEVGVRAQTSAAAGARVEGIYSARQRGVFETTQGDVLKMATDKWKEKAKELDWEPESEADLGKEPPGTRDFAGPGVHPDYSRVYFGARQ